MTTKKAKANEEEVTCKGGKTNRDIHFNKSLPIKTAQQSQRKIYRQTLANAHTHGRTQSLTRTLSNRTFILLFLRTHDRRKRNGQEEVGEERPTRQKKKFNIHSQQTLIAWVIIISPKNTTRTETDTSTHHRDDDNVDDSATERKNYNPNAESVYRTPKKKN